MKNRAFLASLILGISCSSFASDSTNLGISDSKSVEVMQTGRYSKVKNIAPIDQLNPLKVVVQTSVPQSITTVRETIDFLLIRSGYRLAEDEVLSEAAKTLLSHNLPQVHRTLGPMTLDKALNTLSGEAFELVVDPVHRKVGFELSDALARVY